MFKHIAFEVLQETSPQVKEHKGNQKATLEKAWGGAIIPLFAFLILDVLIIMLIFIIFFIYKSVIYLLFITTA